MRAGDGCRRGCSAGNIPDDGRAVVGATHSDSRASVGSLNGSVLDMVGEYICVGFERGLVEFLLQVKVGIHKGDA